MTGEAVALPRILEQREAFGFQRRKPRLSAQNRVEGRGEGMKRLRSLIGRDGLHQPAEGRVGIVENILAEHGARKIGIGALANFRDNDCLGRIVHLDRIEQGPAGLRHEIGRPAVAKLAPHRLLFDFAGFLVLLIREGERRAEGSVGQRGRLAQAERARRRAARRDPFRPENALAGSWHEAQATPRGSDRDVSAKMRAPSCSSGVSAARVSSPCAAADKSSVRAQAPTAR